MIRGHLDRLHRLEHENAELFMALMMLKREKQSSVITADPGPAQHLAPGLIPDEANPPSSPDLTPLERTERATILEYLRKNGFNQSLTSREIGIRPNTLIAKMRKYGLSAPGGNRPGRKRNPHAKP